MSARRILPSVLLLTALLLTGCDPAPPADQGFAGLGGQSQGFAQVTPGRPFQFPQDHGAHPDYRIEWWYLTANLKDEQGNDYGVQWTLFRSALEAGSTQPGWHNRNLWIGHAGLTSRTRQYSAQTLARGGVGQAGVDPAPWRAWIDNWSLSSRSVGADPLAELVVRASASDFTYRLRLTTDRPVVLQGDQGYSRKSSQGQASYYYSQPFFLADGELEFDGKRVKVSGRAWLDREWSSQPLAADQQGWDWFSLHLDDGQQVMLFRLRSQGSEAFYSGNWITADGHSEALAPEDIRISPIRQTSVAGRKVPTHWSIAIARKGLDVQAQALNPKAWMDVGTPYWEGPVRLSGSQSGMGYLEMTGY